MAVAFPAAPRHLAGRQFEQIELAAGSFDVVEYRSGGVVLFGWMLEPDHGAFEEIDVYWNAEPVETIELGRRADVAATLPWVSGASNSGFWIELPDVDFGVPGRIDLIGRRRGQQGARLSTLIWPPSEDVAPLPPPTLAERVSLTSGQQFRNGGLKGFTDLIEQIDRHASGQHIGTVLDWGCGCGRYTRYLIAAGFSRVLGCDIDAEAVAWCADNLLGAEFDHISTDPPTPYEDESVDLVVACSVFTHLARNDQEIWLEELHRITAPGALVLASVHGEYAFRRGQEREEVPGRLGAARGRLRRLRHTAVLRMSGLLDSGADPALGVAAPQGYYRTIYQTRRHTTASWRQHFEVLDYVERGLNGHQDLVVMRRSQASG